MRNTNSNDEIFPGNRGRLREEFFRIASTEARIWLFEQMVDRGIATRDVQSFAENQAELSKEFRLVDISTLRTSMVAKLKDPKLNLGSLQKRVVEIKKDLLLECNGKRHKFRRIVKNLRKDPEKLKENLINKY